MAVHIRLWLENERYGLLWISYRVNVTVYTLRKWFKGINAMKIQAEWRQMYNKMVQHNTAMLINIRDQQWVFKKMSRIETFAISNTYTRIRTYLNIMEQTSTWSTHHIHTLQHVWCSWFRRFIPQHIYELQNK